MKFHNKIRSTEVAMPFHQTINSLQKEFLKVQQFQSAKLVTTMSNPSYIISAQWPHLNKDQLHH